MRVAKSTRLAVGRRGARVSPAPPASSSTPSRVTEVHTLLVVVAPVSATTRRSRPAKPSRAKDWQGARSGAGVRRRRRLRPGRAAWRGTNAGCRLESTRVPSSRRRRTGSGTDRSSTLGRARGGSTSATTTWTTTNTPARQQAPTRRMRRRPLRARRSSVNRTRGLDARTRCVGRGAQSWPHTPALRECGTSSSEDVIHRLEAGLSDPRRQVPVRRRPRRGSRR